MKIINKKTKEVYEVISSISCIPNQDLVLIGNVKTKELSLIASYKIVRDHELKGGKDGTNTRG